VASIRVRPQKSGATTYAVLWVDPDTGKQTSYSLQTRQEADNFKRLIEANGGHLAQTEAMLDAIGRKMPLVRELLTTHIDGQPSITERTRADYRRDAERFINPHIGWLPFDQLSPAHINRWLGVMSGQTRADGELISDKTIANVHGLLSSAISTRLKAGVAGDPTANPCRSLTLPRRTDHTAVEMVCLTRKEWASLDKELGRVLDGHYQPLFRTLAGTGIRWGEAAALTVSDLALDGPMPSIRVVKAQKRSAPGSGAGMYIGPTKTPKSRRTIELPQTLIDDLGKLTRGKPGDALIFTSRRGARISHSNVRQFAWLPAIAAAQDVEKYGAAALAHTPRIHDLRHSHVSWLLAAGVDMYGVQRRLGHEQVTTTTSTYGHLQPEQQRSAALAANAVLNWW
jgi:integrase